jgi:hypothetical protein
MDWKMLKIHKSAMYLSEGIKKNKSFEKEIENN